jgi:hypothetical protein
MSLPSPDSSTADTDHLNDILRPNLSTEQTEADRASSRMSQKKAPSKRKKFWQRFAIIATAVFLLFLSISAVVGIYTYQTAMQLQDQARAMQVTGQEAYDAFKAQNLPGVTEKLTQIDTQLAASYSTFGKLGYLRFVPIARNYYLDGERVFAAGDHGIAAAQKTLGAISPYADVLGFAGEGSFTGGTTEDRIKVVLQTLQKIEPELDGISAELQAANEQLAAIDAERYPESIQGKEVRSRIETIKSFSAGANEALTQYRPVLLRLPSLAGAEGTRRKYLVLFQNDNELRPTGGFLTAYAIINVDNGKVEAEKSDDIYELDKKFTKKEPIPPKLGKYLTTETRFNMRDMNIDPDFKASMDQFIANYKQIKGEPQDIDGVIAIDTEFLKDLMTILGPINVPGYGTFTTENVPQCDCPQIIYALSEIITRPTPYIRENRKGILGPLMRELLLRTYGAPKNQLPLLFETGFADLQGRHIQMYFFNEEDQKAAELLNGAGRMIAPTDGRDYLAIVNANLGGAKSNLFIDYEVLQTVAAPQDGKLEKTVEITYRNNRRGDNCNLEAGLLCLNSTNRDWTRLYVPAGATVTNAQGFTKEPETYEENGFTVIDGFHILEPNSTAKIKVTYSVPYTDQKLYKLTQWKQGGIKAFKLIMDVTGGQEEMVVTKDLNYQAAF